MRNKIKRILNKFGWWLWQKTHITTATEIEVMHEIRHATKKRCEHCGEYALHFLDGCSCQNKRASTPTEIVPKRK